MTASRPSPDPNLANDDQWPAQRRQRGPLPTRPVLLHKNPCAFRSPQRKSLHHSSSPQRLLLHNTNHQTSTSSQRRGLTWGDQSCPQHKRLLLPRLPTATRPDNEGPALVTVLQHPQRLATMAQTQLPHHSANFLHQSPQILQLRNKPLSSQSLPTLISRAQIRLPLSADIGPNRATVTFTRLGPSFGTRITPRLMCQQGFLHSRDAPSR